MAHAVWQDGGFPIRAAIFSARYEKMAQPTYHDYATIPYFSEITNPYLTASNQASNIQTHQDFLTFIHFLKIIISLADGFADQIFSFTGLALA